MEHENEIIGTVGAGIFALIAVAFIKTLFVDAVAPFWLALLGSVALGGTALWACIKVGLYWYRKFKSKKNS
jgi:hypothetical protein